MHIIQLHSQPAQHADQSHDLHSIYGTSQGFAGMPAAFQSVLAVQRSQLRGTLRTLSLKSHSDDHNRYSRDLDNPIIGRRGHACSLILALDQSADLAFGVFPLPTKLIYLGVRQSEISRFGNCGKYLCWKLLPRFLASFVFPDGFVRTRKKEL